MKAKKITLVILILCMLTMSVEADMAKATIKPDVPAWAGGGGNKGNDTLVQKPDNQKLNNVLAPKKDNNKNFDDMQDAPPNGPTWSDYLLGVNNALNIASQIGAGAVGVPSLVGGAVGAIAPQLAGLLPEGKGGDGLTKKIDKKPYDRLANRMLAARSDQLRSAGSGSGAGGGFGSYYGNNWKGYGGGGGGGGGWGGSGGYSNDPAWMNYLLNLYSWNIK